MAVGVLAGWVAQQGLNATQAVLLEALGIPTIESAIYDKLSVIEHKLDVLIRAPFRQAQFYLRERNYDKAKDKLIEAMSFDDFDIPARYLYALILCRLGETTLGVECFDHLVAEFGPHPDLVPATIAQIYVEHVQRKQPLRHVVPFTLDMVGPFRVAEVRCSLAGLAVLWVPIPGKETASSVHVPRVIYFPTIVTYGWNGLEQSRFEPRAEMQFVGITEGYLIVRHNTGIFFKNFVPEVLRLDGSRPRLPARITDTDINAIFTFDSNLSLEVRASWPAPRTVHHYGGIQLIIEESGTIIRVQPELNPLQK